MQWIYYHYSKDDVFIDIVEQVLTDHLAFSLKSFQFACDFFCLLSMPLLVVKHFFESEEVFPCLFVQFLFNVPEDIDEFGDNHMFQSVYSPVGHLDLLIQRQEGCLERSNLDQQVQDAPELLPTLLNGVPSTFEADLTHGVICIFVLFDVEVRDEDTGDVLF